MTKKRVGSGGGFSRVRLRKMGVLRSVLRSRGFNTRGILHHWEWIVGGDLARLCVPIRLSDAGTLVVSAVPESLVELRYKIPVILARLNVYAGGQAVRQIRLNGDFSPGERGIRSVKREVNLSSEGEKLLRNKACGLKSRILRDRLLALGQCVLSHG